MSSHYTDVDRLILERWNEVLDLQDAFKGLNDRMREAIDGVLAKTERWLDDQGYKCDRDSKTPEISAWKPSWEAKKGQPAIRLTIGEFGPHAYGRVRSDHPYLWVMTANLDLLKLKEPERVQFARDLRKALGPAAAMWDDEEVSDADSPLGRYLSDVPDGKRVEMAGQPQQLLDFLQSRFSELFELAPAIDATLAAIRR